MMNKYLKSHITAAAFCAGVLLAVSCSTSREPRTCGREFEFINSKQVKVYAVRPS